MPRFVVLHHVMPSDHARSSHWDLMFEQDAVWRTWALAEQPKPSAVIDAEQLADHRPAYLDYEGPVSRNRGTVERWDAGQYELEQATDDQWIATLIGRRIAGRVTLTRCTASHSWRVSFSAAPTSG